MYSHRIYVLRLSNSYTQTDLARILNLSQRTYSRYENGSNIPIDVLIKLARFYNTTTDYLLGLSDIKNPNYYYK